VGKDVLIEHGGAGSTSRSTSASAAAARRRDAPRLRLGGQRAARARIRVATKYVRAAREHFAAKAMHVDLIKLYGSMELAPLVGLADAIVDLVSTGNTLKANDWWRSRTSCRSARGSSSIPAR
jgi:ATP phosphoribosyltransferase